MEKYGLNVVSFMLMTGWKWWYVVGVYISPKDQPAVRRAEKYLVLCPVLMEIFQVGCINFRIA